MVSTAAVPLPSVGNGSARTILIVDPDESTIADIDAALRSDYRTIMARSGDEAISRLATIAPSVALVAYTLPDMLGLEVCRQLRQHAAPTIIFVTGPDSETNALASYADGADGYLTSAHRLRELDARIRAALRRAPVVPAPVTTAIVVGDVSLDLERHELRLRGMTVRMPLREFSLLSVLLASPGKVWTRDALMRRVWGKLPPAAPSRSTCTSAAFAAESKTTPPDRPESSRSRASATAIWRRRGRARASCSPGPPTLHAAGSSIPPRRPAQQGPNRRVGAPRGVREPRPV